MDARPPGSDGSRSDERDASSTRTPRPGSAQWVEEQRKSASAAGAGLQFGLTICVFALLGNWLDGKFGTGPWLLVAGVLLAFAGGTVSLLKKFS
jgi:F0F1-type ATP synthase assembly protein I